MRKLLVSLLAVASLSTGALVARRAADQDREYRRLILLGDEAFAQDRTKAAIDAFSGAIALKPGSTLAYLKRSDARLRGGQDVKALTSALRDLRTAADLDPGAARPKEKLGDVNFQLQRYRNASESYESYLALDDRAPIVFYKLALAARADGRLPRAVSALRQALALNPSLAEAYYVLGLCMNDLKQPKEARTAFEQAIGLSPALVPVREELADLLHTQGRTRGEIEQLEALATLDPAHADRSIAVGLAYLHAGTDDRALTALGRAAERFQQNRGIDAALGRVWLQRARDTDDPADLRRALEALTPIARQPDASSEVLGLYGTALMMAGRHDEAEVVLQRASQMLPIDPAALLRLATVAERLGHLEAARTALISYSVLVDDDPEEAPHKDRVASLSLQLSRAPKRSSR